MNKPTSKKSTSCNRVFMGQVEIYFNKILTLHEENDNILEKNK